MMQSYFEQCAKYDDIFSDYENWDERRKYEFLITSGLAYLDQRGHVFLTRAGVLLCCRRERIPRDIVHVHVKFVQESEEESFTEELYGSVYYLYQELFKRLSSLFERRIGSPSIRDENGGESIVYEYPKTAIVEALVNFLIHRDYSLDDTAFITVYADRVEFMNPGQSEIPPEELITATAPLRPLYRRNPRLIEAMNKARLNQREGRGIIRIRKELEKNGSSLPDGSLGLILSNDETKNRFILTIYKRRYDKEALGRNYSGRNTALSLSTASALHQLPPPPRDFVGRAAELNELTALLERGSITMSGLQGLGGVGKTALALKLAEQLSPSYPDAQFYFDLKGTTHPLPATDAMAHVVRAYHPTAKLPDAEDELSALYRSVLRGQRALLVMDNAAGRAQIEPLIPPSGCALIVTSRQHFTAPGFFTKSLDTLPADDARALLLTIAPRIAEQEADTIARLCGYLPLALRLAASALAERKDLKAADYVRRLADANQRLKLIDASINLSYELLDERLQKLWRVLAVFPSTFDVPAAAAVWETAQETAQELLGELVKYSLVEWNEYTTRYHIHDLARLFANDRITDAERYASAKRHAPYYLNILRDANNNYLQGGEALRRGLAQFDLDWINIQAGQAWAEAHADEDTIALSLCSNYPTVGAYLLLLRQHPRARIQWLESALRAARRLSNRSVEGAVLGNLGLAYAALGATRSAIEVYEQWLAIARERGDRRNEGSALGNLGNVYVELGETRRAIEFYEQRLSIAREISDRRGQASALGSLGNAYVLLGETQRAIEFYEQQLLIARETGDRRAEGNALGNLGNADALLGETQRAIEFYEQALLIHREIGDRRAEGNALWNMGLALDELGVRAQAMAYAEAALRIHEEIEDPSATKVREKLDEWRKQT